MKRLFCFCATVCSFILSTAQQFGGNPPAVKWQQINTDSFRIIFPRGLDSQAQQVATVVRYLSRNKPLPLGDALHKINIVLQNQTIIANGYVGLGPFRSEFLLTPDMNNFNLGSLPWPEQLAVHEYRHVMQFNNFRNGLSKVFYHLFGQDGLLTAVNASVPDWFYEGDAVFNETLLTNQGRGRLPLFMNAYPSLWLAGKKYSYMKLRNGSYKDYVPNHYNLGYLLVNYGRMKYGEDFWRNVTKDASAFKGLWCPFQKAISRYAGVNFTTFYKEAFTYYKNLVGDTTGLVRQDYISKMTKRFVTNYVFPYRVNDDSIVYLKTSYRELPAFVIKDGQGEHRLRVKDISDDNQFSYRNGIIVYAAYEQDARWGRRDFSVIKKLNMQTGSQQTLTHRSRYFSPDISPDGSKIATVQITTNGHSGLHVLDADNGNLLKQITAEDVQLFTDPKFVSDTELVSAARLKDGRMQLLLINLSSGKVVPLTPASFAVLGYPCADHGFIYFTASYNGNDDVYAVRLNDRKVFRLTSDVLGNYYVNAWNGKLLFSRFTADGYQLQERRLQDLAWTEINPLVLQDVVTRFPVALTEKYGDILNRKLQDDKFTVQKYSKGTQLFNFHSWRPYYEDPDFTFSLYGENVLNTLQTQLYYHYNQNDKTSGVGVSAVYGALFPYLTIGSEYTFNRADSTAGKLRTWRQLDTRLGLSVPLNFSKGRTYKLLSLGSSYVLRNEFISGTARHEFPNVNFGYLYSYISWRQTAQQAVQQIFPRLGYSLSVYHRYALNTYNGYQLLGTGNLYLPGLLVTHSLVLGGAFQQRDTAHLLFSNAFAGARGYLDYYFSRMWRVSANYHFPIAYPNWGFANIVYFQRIRGNLFYDFSKVYSADKTASRQLRSTGAELYVDTRWWNEYPLSFGIRYSHLLDSELTGLPRRNVVEIILPVSILPR